MPSEVKIEGSETHKPPQMADRESVFKLLRNLRDVVDATIDHVKTLWWQPREYEGAVARVYDSAKTTEQNAVLEVAADDCATVSFGVDLLGQEAIAGIPETRRSNGFGFDRLCEIQRLEIDDEDAPHFVVEEFSIGAYAMIWGCAIPATRFSKTAAQPINYYAARGMSAMLKLRCKSDAPRALPRVKLVVLEMLT